jgi:hypothetical protein
MTRAGLHFHALALGAAALISLISLSSEAIAKSEIRHSRSPAIAVHRSGAPAAHAFRGTALGGGHRLVSARAHVANRRYASVHGHSRGWRGYGYGGAALAGRVVAESGYSTYGGRYYSEGYGYGYLHGHSCRWYAYHEPYNIPYRCRGSYGYSYGYVAPSYGYGYEYGHSYSYRYHSGGAWRGGYHNHYATTGDAHRSTHLAGARVHSAPHFVARGGPRFAAHGGTHMLARSGPHLAGGGEHIRRHGP